MSIYEIKKKEKKLYGNFMKGQLIALYAKGLSCLLFELF